MENNQKNCVKAADELKQWSVQNGKEFESLKVEASQLSAEKKAEIKEKHEGRMKIVMAKIMRTTLKCAKEPQFTEAMKNISIK